ncbi:MAG: hypothetical protein LAQ30_18345 [Acidobacteriia bacterium]|nr:hypothetical protein [Terriglobia bacterium]
MEEEKTTAAPTGAPGASCFFCTVLPMLERRWDEATRGHFKNARIEFLKGVRSLIDDRIARLATEERKGTHVTVE